MRYSARSGFTLVEWLVGVIAVVMLAALLIPAFVRASRQDKVLACKANLHGLFKAQAAAAAQDPVPLGKAFWVRLNATSFARCPLAEQHHGEVDYLGPASNPAGLGAKDPLGCDDVENHGPHGREGGNVLLKSGEVHTDNFQLWGAAVHGGKCRP